MSTPPALVPEEATPLEITAASESLEPIATTALAVEVPTGIFSAWTRVAKPLAGFFGVQITVQIIAAIAGLLLVRAMTKQEYGFYTIATSMQGTMSILTDIGVGSALSAIGGLVWQDKYRFGQLLKTALMFRRQFGIFAVLAIVPLLYWLLTSHGAGTGYALLISMLIAASINIQLTNGVLIVAPRLHARVTVLQYSDLIGAGLRLVLIGAACLLWINAILAVTISLLAFGLQNLFLGRSASKDADLKAPVSREDGKSIWKLVRQQAPNSIYYCIQGQLVVFLVAVFGNAHRVADVGALGRLTIGFTAIASVMSNIVLPRFARCQDARRLKQMYLQITMAFISVAVVCLLITFLFPRPLLWLLGAKYGQLRTELVYMVFASVVSAIADTLYSLNAARGWLRRGWLAIPITIGIQLALLPVLDVRTVKGAVLLSSLPVIPGVMPYVFEAHRALRNLAAQQAPAPPIAVA